MITQTSPPYCVPALIRRLNETTVICGAQQESGVTFLIICTNKLLTGKAKRHSDVTLNDLWCQRYRISGGDKTQSTLYLCAVSESKIKSNCNKPKGPFKLSMTCFSSFTLSRITLWHVCNSQSELSKQGVLKQCPASKMRGECWILMFICETVCLISVICGKLQGCPPPKKLI